MTANKTIAATTLAAFASLASACTEPISLGSEDPDAGVTSTNALAYVCATSCTGTCVSGRCRTVLASGTTPRSIAVDATNAYWVTDSAVMKVPLAGGTPTTLAMGQIFSFSSTPQLAVDATHVYWLTDGSVLKVPLDGGPTTTVWSGDTSAYRGIAVDATNVYWAIDDGMEMGVMKAPTAGGTPTTLGTEPATATFGIAAFAIDDTSAYWLTDDRRLTKVPLRGGTVTTSPGFHQPYDLQLVAGGTELYWIDFSGDIFQYPTTGSLPVADGPTALVSGLGTVMSQVSLAVDSTSVYWTANSAGMRGTAPEGGLDTVYNSLVMKVARSGGTPIILDTVPEDERQGPITVDATSVYWGTSNGLVKLTPK